MKMTRPSLPDRPDQSQFIQHIGKLRIQLNGIQSQMMPEALAERTGTQFVVETGNSGKYIFEILEQEVCLVYPEWVVKDSLSNKDLPPTTQALVLFYFITADGTSPDGRWISFSNLPDGRFYNPAYQGYTGGELAKNFQNDLEAFGKAATDNWVVSIGQQCQKSPETSPIVFKPCRVWPFYLFVGKATKTFQLLTEFCLKAQPPIICQRMFALT